MNIGERTAAEPAAPEGKHRRRAILWFCAAFLAVQLLVPVYRLTLPPNQTFGWQMYSSLTGYAFEVKLAGGTSRTVDPTDYVLRFRSEIDFRNYLPQVLCREFPEATEVVASIPGIKGSSEGYPCER
jgi:hypothetical protein